MITCGVYLQCDISFQWNLAVLPLLLSTLILLLSGVSRFSALFCVLFVLVCLFESLLLCSSACLPPSFFQGALDSWVATNVAHSFPSRRQCPFLTVSALRYCFYCFNCIPRKTHLLVSSSLVWFIYTLFCLCIPSLCRCLPL